MSIPMDPTQPEGQPSRASSSAKTTRLSCVNCRKRKVKCDRREPYCANCEKHQELCFYPTERKRVVRRSAYKDMAQRLEKMERLISDFAIDPKSIDSTSPPSVTEDSPSVGSPDNKLSKISTHPILRSIEKSDFEWVNDWSPFEERALRGGKVREPYREDRFIPQLWPDGTQSGHTGSHSLFSPDGIRFVNHLVGDDSFSKMLSTLTPIRKLRGLDFDTFSRQPLPSGEILLPAVEEFLNTLNRDLTIFQDEAIMEGLHAHLSGASNPGVAWYAAINIILAHAFKSNVVLKRMVGADESNKYLYNAMSMIPSLMLHPPSELGIGALLSTSMFFTFGFEKEVAVAILGSAIQLMTTAGYQYNKAPPGVSELQLLHRRKLYWHGFCQDCDLSLRLGRPPITNEGQIIDLPDENPIDGRNVISYNGKTFNFLREHVALSKLQYKAYSLLYSDKRVNQPAEELYASIDELDEGLRRWKENVPEIIRPANASEYTRVITITVLHYTYYQLMIAIHSIVFVGKCPDEPEDRILPSVALCVGAARASISLLNYHDNTHLFAVFLVNHVAWSVDILFMNILHNKTGSRVYDDLELLAKILKFYEKYDENRANTPAYKITKGLYKIATRTVKAAIAGPLNDTTSLPSQPEPSGPLDTVPEFDTNSLPMAGMDYATNGLDNMNFLDSVDSEWMMPMGFQPQYWQDPWANVFQDNDMSDLSLQSNMSNLQGM